MKDKSKGITLIALVITIIILLILAGITIMQLQGNGLFQKAQRAGEITNEVTAKEELETKVYEVQIEKEGNATLQDLVNYLDEDKENNYVISLTKTAKVTGVTNVEGVTEIYVLYKGYEFKISGNLKIESVGKSASSGNQSGNGENEGDKKPLNKTIKVGDYVAYDPTIADKAGTKVDTSKLTYTSPTGTKIENGSVEELTHGNGYTSTETGGGQTYTAKPLSELKWRILNIFDDKVELISEVPIKKNNTTQNNGELTIDGRVGYLYAEKELNEICKIYGYGYGADTNIRTTYEIGGPKDATVVEQMEGTGARSITKKDLNKLANVTENDFTILNKNYGNDSLLTEAIYYPTLYGGQGMQLAMSTNKESKFEVTSYQYSKDKIQDSDLRELLFNGNYFIASREGNVLSNTYQFAVSGVFGNYVTFKFVCIGTSNGVAANSSVRSASTGAVRPIVAIKSDMLDVSKINENMGNSDNPWILK